MTIVNVLRGSTRYHSIIGLERCSYADWSLFATFLIVCGIVSSYQIMTVRKEQHLKDKVGYGVVPSDVRLTRSSLLKLIIFAFSGGLASGALGLGGGIIFNPLILSMGVAP
jgi:uncharacterized membrane protein YfcA